MKIEEIIKKIASEFNEEETEVSEYFDNIFESLALAFLKNKNVNIGEFGKFKVQTKSDEEGKKQKSVLFSPVKKFADEINHNFTELSPVHVRLLSEKLLAEKLSGDFSRDEDSGEIILIDFEGNEFSPTEEKPDVYKEALIPEETEQEAVFSKDEQKIKEDILIPEDGSHEIVYSHEEHTIKEEILIPEEKKEEVLIREEKNEEVLIPEVKKEEVSSFASIVSEIEESEPEIIDDIIVHKDKILALLSKINIIQNTIPDFDEIISLKKLISIDKKVHSVISTIVKIDKENEQVFETKLMDEGETEIFIPEKSLDERISLEEAKPSELIEEDKVEEIKQEEAVEETIADSEEIPTEKTEEIKEEQKEIEEKHAEINQEKIKEEQEKNLINKELESKLLNMLDERRKIIEEIRKLDEINSEDFLNIPRPKEKTPEEEEKPTNEEEKEKPKQNVFIDEDESLDKPKQNIFVEEDAKQLEELIKYLEFPSEISEGDIIKEDEREEPKIVNNEETPEEKTEEKIPDDIKPKEEIVNEEIQKDSDAKELENLFGTIYEEKKETDDLSGISEAQPHLNNLEMKVFDRLLDESSDKTEEEKPIPDEVKNEEQTSIKELEDLFVNFKTEKTEDEIIKEKEVPEKKEEEKAEVKKTDTIKTYDDIFSLIEPNGNKKNGKNQEQQQPLLAQQEEPKKKMSNDLKIIIYSAILIVIIIISFVLYRKSIYTPVKENKKLPLTAPIDSVRTSGKDSVVFADTEKVNKAPADNVVYEENDIVIKESDEGFYIFFGSYLSQFELAKKIKELKAKKIYPTFDEVNENGKQIYRLKIGPYETLNQARNIIPKL